MQKEIEILKEKKEFKNYNELCKCLSWSNSRGKQRDLNFKKLSDICRYTRKGHRIIIEEVFDKQKERIKQSKVKYTDNIESIILGSLARSGCNRVTIGKTSLLRAVGLINYNYTLANEYQYKFKKLLNVDIKTVNEWFRLNGKSLKDDLSRALKRLSDRKLIYYSVNQTICRYELDEENTNYIFTTYIDDFGNKHKQSEIEAKGKKVFAIATEEEKLIILTASRDTLEQLGFDDISDVVRNGKADEYYSQLYKRIRKVIKNFDYFYDCYDITFDVQKIQEELQRRGYEYWKDEDILKNIEEVNKGAMEKVNKNSKKRQNKTLKLEAEDMTKFNKFLYRTKEDYLKEVELITNNVVRHNAPSIKGKLSTIIVKPEDFLGLK